MEVVCGGVRRYLAPTLPHCGRLRASFIKFSNLTVRKTHKDFLEQRLSGKSLWVFVTSYRIRPAFCSYGCLTHFLLGVPLLRYGDWVALHLVRPVGQRGRSRPRWSRLFRQHGWSIRWNYNQERTVRLHVMHVSRSEIHGPRLNRPIWSKKKSQ